MTLDDDFDAFLDELQLETRQIDRMNSAEHSLSKALRAHFGLNSEDTFLQGSYANGSAIKPPPTAQDGEYDIDLVVVSAKPGQDPRSALGDMRSALIAIGYGDRIEEDPDRERPCICLRYAPDDAGHFHVDVVPAREASGLAPLEIPRPAEGMWKETAPQEYAEWCMTQGEEFLRTVQQLKRWRDENQDARQAIKSIVLQVLISEHMPRGQVDAERIAMTLRSISDLVTRSTTPPEVTNPVLRTENLTATWPLDAFRNFVKVVSDAADLAERALAEENDEALSRELWRKLLGSDFPERGGGTQGSVPPSPAPTIRKTRQGAPRSEWA